MAPGVELAALRPLLLRLAQLQLRNHAWAEDAVSETLVAAVEALPSFRGESALRTWAVGILKHKIVDQMRRNGREVSLEAEAELRGGDGLDALFREDGHRVERPRDWGDPQGELAQRQFLDIVQACLDVLPAALARAFLLREWLELDTGAVCRELGISSSNCFVMLYRARMRLRECLDARWFGEGGRAGGTPP
jgi:RNA polymerase sigma-70 factor (ECF subfamily)